MVDGGLPNLSCNDGKALHMLATKKYFVYLCVSKCWGQTRLCGNLRLCSSKSEIHVNHLEDLRKLSVLILLAIVTRMPLICDVHPSEHIRNRFHPVKALNVPPFCPCLWCCIERVNHRRPISTSPWYPNHRAFHREEEMTNFVKFRSPVLSVGRQKRIHQAS